MPLEAQTHSDHSVCAPTQLITTALLNGQLATQERYLAALATIMALAAR